MSSQTLTNGAHNQQNEKRLQDGYNRRRKRHHDILQAFQSAEQADDTEGSQGANDIDRYFDRPESDKRHQNDNEIKYVPAIGNKWLEPMSKSVQGKFSSEDDCEKFIQFLQISPNCSQ